ncbi:MAG: FAD-dependent monooxygenase [Vulcanimicrobiaceae bacterium]
MVGAGPTGLVLALWLVRAGVRVRIIDRAERAGTTSRAIVVHARSLEFYRQLGIADAAVQGGSRFVAANLWVGGRRAGRVPFGDIGAGLSPYPYMLVFSQDAHERLLEEELERWGVTVERRTALASFEQTGDGVRARLEQGPGRELLCEARYLAGCDGAHSTVRAALDVGFRGGTYAALFYVADIVASGAVTDGELHAALDHADFLAVFPMKGRGQVRLVGVLRAPRDRGGPPVWADVDERIVRGLAVTVDEVRWFSTYRVHHRVADAFRSRNAFLVGDAAHVHSPVGGQGMNTGIGDAVNLAWKLAAVVRGRADVAILDSYEAERMGFARTLVSTTDRAFTFVSARGAIATRVRLTLVPALLPVAFRFKAVRRLAFRTVSQTALRYRHSPLSVGAAGRVRAGDRLPWVCAALPGNPTGDNFASLASRDWQVHVYGTAAAALRLACSAKRLPLHVFAASAATRRAGLREDAVYLVRPDGYVGFAGAAGDMLQFERYLAERRIGGGGGTI